MTDETEHRSYNVPEAGEENWHEPVNENWEAIDADMQEALDQAGSGETEALAAHNVFVYEIGSDDYEAVDSDGTLIESGSDGPTILQSAINACPDGGTIYVDGHYFIDSVVTVGDGKTLWCYSAEFEIPASESHEYNIVLADGSENNSYDLTQDANRRDNHIHVTDVSDWEIGELVRLRRDSSVHEYIDQDSELHKVVEIDEGNDNLIVHDPIRLDYPTDDGAVAFHIEPDQGNLFGATVQGPGMYDDGYFCHDLRGDNCVIRDCDVRDFGGIAFYNQSSYGTKFIDNTIERGNINGRGYGINIRWASANTLIANNQIRNFRHCVSHTPNTSHRGLPRGCCIVDNELHGTDNSAVLDAHTGTIDWYIYGNHITGNDNNAIQCGAVYTHISGNYFFGTHDERADEGGFFRTEDDHSYADAKLVIENNLIISPGGGFGCFELRDSSPTGWGLIDISNNTIINHDGIRGIVRCRPDVDHFRFANNTLDDLEQPGAGDYGFFQDRGHIEFLDISGNAFMGMEDDSVNINGTVDEISISNNYFNNGENSIINLGTADIHSGICAFNRVQDPDGRFSGGIELGIGVSNVIVKDNMIHIAGVSSGDALDDNGSGTVSDGNYFHDGTGWSELT